MDQEGRVLCRDGKKKVYNAMAAIKDQLYSSPEDASNFLATLQSEPGLFVDRTVDTTGRLENVFWATVDQQNKIARYGACIQMDTTVFTNKYGCPLLFIVGVDDENRSCVLAQCLLRSGCTETFEWILTCWDGGSGGRRPQVFLTDGDRAMTAALRGWKTTLHLYCLWHIFKNVKNCGSSFPDIDERSRMLGLFGSAAYAATPEAFNKHSADLERTVAGKACAEYIQDLIEDKTKWAFSCRPTVMTLGMAATQLSEGLFGVAKRAGVEKSLSLCALWEKLQSVNKSLEIASASLGTRAIAAERPFQVAHLDKFFDPVKVEHERVGASQICQRDLRDELGGSQSYEVEIVASGAAGDDSSPLPLGNDRLRQAVHGAQQNRNAFQEAPPLTDLEQDSKHGSYAQTTDDTTPWGRTSSSTFLDLLGNVPIHLVILVRYKLTRTKQSHIVVFGPNNFHLCSCLKLLRLGLPCRHYFAALLRFLDGVYRGQSLGHDFHGSSVHNRWRKSPDGNDEPWSVSSVLQEAGLGKDWDGGDEGLDDNYEGPTFDDDCGGEGVHPAEREGRATQRKACDQRRVFATMMAKSKENVGEILKAVPFDQALHIQAEVDKYVRYLLADADADGDTKTKNPAPVKPPGRPKGQGASSQTTVSIPRARKDNTKRKTRFKGSEEGGRKRKKIKQENPT
eukprot:g13071.t1